MAHQAAATIEIPRLALASAGVADYCEGLLATRGQSYWWYQAPAADARRTGRPVRFGADDWWVEVRRGLAWPADLLTPRRDKPSIPIGRGFAGLQYPVADATRANSALRLNLVEDVQAYSEASIREKRRAVRKGLRALRIEPLDPDDAAALEGCRVAWNDLNARTNWRPLVDDRSVWERSLREMLALPGATTLVARRATDGAVAGFLIAKCVGEVFYVDTIACSADDLDLNPNDALIFVGVRNAADVPGVRVAHYGLVSFVESLERFKRKIGFRAVDLPARAQLLPGVKPLLRLAAPSAWRRLVGAAGE